MCARAANSHSAKQPAAVFDPWRAGAAPQESVDAGFVFAFSQTGGLRAVADQDLRRSVLVVLLFFDGLIVELGLWLGVLDDRDIGEGVIEEWLEVFFAGEVVGLGDFAVGSEGVEFLALDGGGGVFVGWAAAVGATVTDAGLAAEVVGPAFGKLGTGDVGVEDVVDGAVVEDYVARGFADAEFEGARGLGGVLVGVGAVMRAGCFCVRDEEWK
jgi:hypothetical protein